MIFSTTQQLNCFLLFVFLGILLSIIFNIFFILFLKNKSKIIKKIILDSVFCTIFCIFFVIFLNLFNFGKFSLALVFAYLLGYFWFKYLVKKTVDKLANKWYNLIKGKIKNEKSKPQT